MLKNTKDTEAATQIERFKQTARELGCDEDEAAFDEKLRALAKQKPKDDKPEIEHPKKS
jgi:hypothetical protein